MLNNSPTFSSPLSEREFQDSLEDPTEGRTFASITRVKDAGHLVRTFSLSNFLAL